MFESKKINWDNYGLIFFYWDNEIIFLDRSIFKIKKFVVFAHYVFANQLMFKCFSLFNELKTH